MFRMAQKVYLRSDAARAQLSALGLTQVALALECELDIRTVQRWFAGQPVRLAEAERLARALQRGTADLFDGVDEDGPEAGPFALFSFLGRLPGLRDHPSAKVLRSVPSTYGAFMAPLQFRPHPLRGYVVPYGLPVGARGGFIALRIHTASPDATLRVIVRLAPSVLLERGYVLARGDEVWLNENHFVRSMRAPRRAEDQSFDLWYWVGSEATELLLTCSHEFSVTEAQVLPQDRTLFDMSSPSNAHAVCVRPGVTHLSDAGLGKGFDRLLNRDPTRVDIPEPGPRTTLSSSKDEAIRQRRSMPTQPRTTLG